MPTLAGFDGKKKRKRIRVDKPTKTLPQELVATELHGRLLDVTPIVWREWTSNGGRVGDAFIDPSGRVYLRCEPVPCLMLDVVLQPLKERGDWLVHWFARGCQMRGHDDNIEEAKQQALDAGETLLARSLDALERMRANGG